MKMSSWLKGILIVGLSGFLVACSREKLQLPSLTRNNQDLRLCSLDPKFLTRYKIDLLADANTLILIVPNRWMFTQASANLTSDTAAILRQIAALSRCGYRGSTKVISYFAGLHGQDFSQALALERAKGVAELLWQYGLGGNFVAADGVVGGFLKEGRIWQDVTLITLKQEERG